MRNGPLPNGEKLLFPQLLLFDLLFVFFLRGRKKRRKPRVGDWPADECKKRLTSAGFVGLSERDTWQGKLEPGGKYFFTRNYSSIVAFYVGKK